MDWIRCYSVQQFSLYEATPIQELNGGELGARLGSSQARAGFIRLDLDAVVIGERGPIVWRQQSTMKALQ